MRILVNNVEGNGLRAGAGIKEKCDTKFQMAGLVQGRNGRICGIVASEDWQARTVDVGLRRRFKVHNSPSSLALLCSPLFALHSPHLEQ